MGQGGGHAYETSGPRVWDGIGRVDVLKLGWGRGPGSGTGVRVWGL